MDLAKKVEIFRSRFHGRQDVYGRARKIDDNGKERLVYAKVCSNLWAEDCVLRRGLSCSDCSVFAPIAVDTVCIEDHISAKETHNFYLVLDEGLVRFGAVDFDVKPGKEDKGYDFFEVQKFTSILRAQGIEHGIARSSGDGYHVYMFFKDPYPAVRFRAVMQKLFYGAGFNRYVDQGIKLGYPEIFPKQDYVAHGSYGNGITPPMQEPKIMKGRKCWVDEEDRVIGESAATGEELIEAQWRHLEEMPWTDPAAFERIIEEHNLKIDDIPTLKKRAEKGDSAVDIMGISGTSGAGTARPFGHVERVIFGCEAFRGLYERIRDHGHHPNHDEGLALWHLCMNTVDGKEWFKANVKTWGRTQKDIRELEYSVRKNYRPTSCEKMKEQGICHKDGLCAEAAPKPLSADPSLTDGALEDLNEQDRRKHNPYRFAFADGAELLHQLIAEADRLMELNEAEDADAETKERRLQEKEEKLKDLVRRAQALDKKKLRNFKDHIDKLQKPLKIPKNRIAPIFKKASEERFEREQEVLQEDVTVYEFGSYVYRKRYGDGKYGYFQITKGKDSIVETLLLEMDIIIKEERYYTEDGGVTRTVYKGYVRNGNGEKNFEIDTDTWASDVEFQKFFTKLMGGAFSPVRKQIEHIKQAALGWCEKRNLTVKISSLMTQGFYEGHYLMPSVTVDASGLRPTSPGVLEIGHKDVVKNLDWKILDDVDFLETLRHIKDDFLVAWPEEWTYIGLAHIFRPLMRNLMNWQSFPTLFYDGLTGLGKSEITKMLQKFWGRFESLVNLTVTQKYLEEMAYEFNDACLVLDDFKGLTPQQKNAVMHQIQYGYDGSSTGKLNRDSTARKARKNRATLVMSGENFIQNQASVVARTLLIDVHQFDKQKTFDAYLNCMKMSKNYCGITPRFLHWLFSRDREILQQEYDNIRLTLYKFAKGRQNASRIAENVAANHLTWKQFTSFMEDAAVISNVERNELDNRHWSIAQSLFHRMVVRCEEEQEGVNFKSILVALVLSGGVRVEGLKLHAENPRAPVVGFIPNPVDQTVGYYYPDAVMNAVNEVLRPQGVVLPKTTVARQLIDAKIIKEVDAQRLNKLVRRGAGRVRVWVIDHSVLELVFGDVPQEAAPPENVIELKPGTQAFRDGMGLF
jgi:hypothetical protein